METDWAENRAKMPQDIIRGTARQLLDSMYSTSERDKFRTRLERSAGPATHRDLHQPSRHGGGVHDRRPSKGNRPALAAAPAGPELEAEFLRRLMVRLRRRARSSAKRRSPPRRRRPDRAELVEGERRHEPLRGERPLRPRLAPRGLALDRVGFTVEDRDRQKGLYFVRYVDPEQRMPKKDNEKGLFSTSSVLASSDPKVTARAIPHPGEAEQTTRAGAGPGQGRRAPRLDPTAQRILVAAPRPAQIALLRFASLGSGSRGNCLVVEAGTEPRVTRCCSTAASRSPIHERRLARLGLAPRDIDGMLVTHEHDDHARRRVRLRRRATTSPVYLTLRHDARDDGRGQGARGRAHGARQRQAERARIGGMQVSPFTVPHDAREPVQFVLSDGDAQARRAHRHRACPRRTSRRCSPGCDALVLECNHDRDMLWSGSYPKWLKQRIAGRFRASGQRGFGAAARRARLLEA